MSQTLAYQPPQPRLSGDGLKGRDGYPYFPHPDLVAAANAALAVEMPLLLTGEAGCGKTDFAFAVAGGLGHDPAAGEETPRLLECYVRSDSRARDLLYHYDAIRRFGDAQHGGDPGRQRAEDPRPYLRLEALGEALVAPRLRVVLIDEIDKAPRDLPNDLLRELDQGHFEIREIPPADDGPTAAVAVGDPATYRSTMARPEGAPKPLVIITSNVERQLPDPFLRRCVFFHIPFPKDDELRKILRARFDQAVPYLDQVIAIFGALRDVPSLTKRPTTSELVSWVAALRQLYAPGTVEGALAPFFTAGRKPSEQRWSELPWGSLPALGCLVKLREDLARLEGRA